MTDAKSSLAFVGTYTSDGSDGVYSYRLDGETGDLEALGATAMGEEPSFLAIHPNGEYLYAVNEVDGGSVTAGKIDTETGTITQLNSQPSGDDGPCHCSVDATGQYVMAAHYGGGSVSMLPIEDDGCLGEPSTVVDHDPTDFEQDSSTTPRPHSINPGPENCFAYVPDLGLDEVVVYEMDLEAGRLDFSSSVSVQSGAGPRHLVFHPTNGLVYVIDELDSSMIVFERDAQTGELAEIQTVSTLPDDFDGENYPADVQVHPSGEWVFGSNRGHDSIATFAVDDETGELELTSLEPTGGEWPRNFAIDPSGSFLFAENQNTDDIHVFRIGDDGELEATGASVDVPSPVCMEFLS